MVPRNVYEVVVFFGDHCFVVDCKIFNVVVDGVDQQFCEVEMLKVEIELGESVVLDGIEDDVEVVVCGTWTNDSCSELCGGLIKAHLNAVICKISIIKDD